MMGNTLQNWTEIFRTQGLSPERSMDEGSRWLLITRASVLPVTLFSGLIGGLLAAGSPAAHWFHLILVLVGLVTAHATSNMLNDYFDLETGVESEESGRARYAPHPVISGLISRKGLLLAIALAILMDLGILLFLTEVRGWPVSAFALMGLFIAVFYVVPPIKLKHRGLGEPGALIIWGPLMSGGAYYVTTGGLEPWVLVASLPYAILVTTVLMGRHIDRHDVDAAAGARTLPVILGRERALFLNQELMVSFFVLVACLVLVGTLGVWALLSFLALPCLWHALRAYSQPRPESPPAGFSLWPLWYVAWSFRLTRTAGALLVVGLLLNAVFPVHLG